MITDDVRRETAKRLREKKKEFFGERSWFPQDLILYQSMYLTAIDECLPDGECGFDVLADLIEPEPVTGETSDGFHTFDELYRHRAVLFSFIVACFPGASWKSRRHHDGTMYDGMFIVGIETPWGGRRRTTTTPTNAGTCSRARSSTVRRSGTGTRRTRQSNELSASRGDSPMHAAARGLKSGPAGTSTTTWHTAHATTASCARSAAARSRMRSTTE